MSNNNNQINVPEAKEAMNRFKMECANEVGVSTTNRFYAEFVGFKGANRACCVYIRLGGITSTEFHKI